MVHRGIATLSGLLMSCFLLLGHFEPEFFLLHFYQSLIFLVIILMLFYFQDHWAYMLGMLAPAAWLLLTFATGVLGGAFAHVARLMFASRATPVSQVGILEAITAVLSVLMIVFCARRWRREYAGLGKWASTFLPCLGIVGVYYGVLIFWFWQIIPRG